MFYTYAHIKPNGEIFYIGKGQGKRAWSKQNRNTYWKNIVAKHGFTVQILGQFETEQDAFCEEIELISHFNKFEKLCNLTAGGEGLSGHKHSDKTKAKIKMELTGKVHSEVTKLKHSVLSSGSNNGNFKGLTVAKNIKTGLEITLDGPKEMNKNGFSHSKIYACLNGKRKTHKGYTFTRIEK